MLGQRRRRWSNIDTTFCQCIMLNGIVAHQSKNVVTAYLKSKESPPFGSALKHIVDQALSWLPSEEIVLIQKIRVSGPVLIRLMLGHYRRR